MNFFVNRLMGTRPRASTSSQIGVLYGATFDKTTIP
jgi:hypothetical protein